MALQAYLDNIKVKTGKTPEDFRDLAQKKGLLNPGVTARQIVDWLKTDFDLRRGYSMAIYEVFKAEGWISAYKKPQAKTARN